MKNPARSSSLSTSSFVRAAAVLAVGLAASVGLVQGAAAQSAEAGAKKAAMCFGCHSISGYQASFPEVYKVPMIAGQNEKYLASSLAQYKKGDRKHPSMRAVAASLSDQDMADLAAYFHRIGAEGTPSPTPVSATTPAAATAAAPADVPADIAELLKKSNCASCHGANLNAPIDPSYPKIAGQHGDYLYQALKAYKVSNNPQVGRNNAIMAGMVAPYTLAELKRLSSYIGGLHGDVKTVPQSRFR